MNPYSIIITVSSIIILSFLFNIIAKKTNVPSVLMLIVLGVLIQCLFWQPDLKGSDKSLMKILEVIGNVGLIFIVLEAALDLKLQKDKLATIVKSFFIALLSLIACTFLISFLFSIFWQNTPFVNLLMYAIPISIMSSAIIIPSVQSLIDSKKEFMVYESTFSDILGIMFFYFLKENAFATSTFEVVKNVSTNIALTVFIALLASYLLVLLFNNLKTKTKYFLLFAVLLMLYAIGKSFHLSSLLIILFFGLTMNNAKLFFFGRFKSLLPKEKDALESNHQLHIITLETAFVLRTFFFVLFGITISLSSLIDVQVAFISLLIIGVLFGVRFIFLKLFLGKNIAPEIWIAPRGLITILLFFSIPNGLIDNHGKLLPTYLQQYDFTIQGFDQGILLYTILISSVIMAFALIKHKSGSIKDKLKDITSNFEADNIEE